MAVYPDRVDENLRRMVAMAGGVERLRPHVKTHKMPDVVRRKLALGITKFKCATIAEAEMLAHLAELLQADIRRATVRRLDMVRDTTLVDVRYRLAGPRPSGS